MPRSFEEQQSLVNQAAIDLAKRQQQQISELQDEVAALKLSLTQLVGVSAYGFDDPAGWLDEMKNAIGKALRKRGSSKRNLKIAELTDQLFDRANSAIKYKNRIKDKH